MFQTKQRILMDKVSLILIIILLCLRFPLLFAAGFGLTDGMVSLFIYELGTYLCTGILICRNIKSLNQYCISVPALAFFLLLPTFAYIINPNSPNSIKYAIRIVMAVAFAVYLICKKDVLSTVKNDTKAIIQNCFFVIPCIVIIALLSAYLRGFSGGGHQYITPTILAEMLAVQLCNAASFEEPLFRGFLWGIFRQLGFKEISICILQALLFWLAHLYYLNTGTTLINFWVVSIASIILGFVIMKTKSIAYSMVTHSFMNTLGDIFQHFIKLF